MVSGPAGIGKTRLIGEVIKSLPKELSESCIYLPAAGGLRQMLGGLLRKLLVTGDPTLLRQVRADGFRRTDFKAWLNAQSSSHLKGTLYRAAEKRTYWIFLDLLSAITPPAAKVITELVRMRDTPVYLLTRELKGQTAEQLLKLYWRDEQRLSLGPLPETAARSLVESVSKSFALGQLELQTFRREVLRRSGRIPGAIVQMCALAAEPRYQAGLRVETGLLHVDYLLRGREKLPRLEKVTE
jgi:hypothetical protein